MTWFPQLSWSAATALAIAVSLGVGIAISALRKRRRRGLAVIRRSPFFRSVTDSYYRAGKLR